MWIDAGRTCDIDSDNTQVDLDKGLVTVKVIWNWFIGEGD